MLHFAISYFVLCLLPSDHEDKRIGYSKKIAMKATVNNWKSVYRYLSISTHIKDNLIRYAFTGSAIALVLCMNYSPGELHEEKGVVWWVYVANNAAVKSFEEWLH